MYYVLKWLKVVKTFWKKRIIEEKGQIPNDSIFKTAPDSSDTVQSSEYLPLAGKYYTFEWILNWESTVMSEWIIWLESNTELKWI